MGLAFVRRILIIATRVFWLLRGKVLNMNISGVGRILFTLGVLSSIFFYFPTAGASGGKTPIPEKKALSESRALIDEVYGAEIKKAVTAARKAELAGVLLNDAGESERPANKYVLLLGAVHLASKSGDVEKTFAALESLASFDCDHPSHVNRELVPISIVPINSISRRRAKIALGM